MEVLDLRGIQSHIRFIEGKSDYDKEAEAYAMLQIGQNLQGTNVHTVILDNNDLTLYQICKFVESLAWTKVKRIGLQSTFGKFSVNPEPEDYVCTPEQLGKSLRKTNIKEIDLSNNYFGKEPSLLAQIVEGLNGTSIEVINFYVCSPNNYFKPRNFYGILKNTNIRDVECMNKAGSFGDVIDLSSMF